MAYECKIYDKKGKLVKIVSGNNLDSKADQKLFDQPSTKKAIEFIKNLKDPKKEVKTEGKKYAKQMIDVGVSDLNYVEITKGLKIGDIVSLVKPDSDLITETKN